MGSSNGAYAEVSCALRRKSRALMAADYKLRAKGALIYPSALTFAEFRRPKDKGDQSCCRSRMGASQRRPEARARAHGFTLLEILIVVVIIGVIVSAATLAIGVLGGDREVEDQTRRFWAVLQQAREEAELQGNDVAVFISASAYEFLRFDTRRDMWIPIQYDELYRPRELPEGLRYRLWLDGREVVLKVQPPNRSDEDEHKKWPPQIMVLSSGDIMPFELRIERDAADALWRIVAAPDNDLRIERRGNERQSERDWIMVAQTKAPEDADARERVSDARR
jgi:general secretion pathway protein H